MTTTAPDAARTLLRRAFHWLSLGTLLCLSWAIAAAAPTVELLRDPWGTPHIFATTETDGFFGLGYAAAEDRLLQMELIRRKAAGRLAEVFGRPGPRGHPLRRSGVPGAVGDRDVVEPKGVAGAPGQLPPLV